MAVLGSILSGIGGIGSLICLILVLIKMFPAEGVLKGILAIICSLYAFIWGWINAGRFNLRNVMWAWTACIILAVIGGSLSGMSAQSAIQDLEGSVWPQLMLVYETLVSIPVSIILA